MLVELAITAVVLAVIGALVQTTPARTAAASRRSCPAAGVYSATLTQHRSTAAGGGRPGQGAATTRCTCTRTRPDGTSRCRWWSGRPPRRCPRPGIEPIEIPLLRITDNHAIGEITLPTPGEWQLRFTLRTSEIDQATVTATVPDQMRGHHR